MDPVLDTPVLLYLIVGVITLCSGTDYCNTECGKQHTMCKFSEDDPGSACVDYRKMLFELKDKRTLLDTHNKYRNKVATGQERGQPKAANMIQLIWDEELATIAQKWADQCLFQHDECRNVERFHVGQSLFYFKSSDLNDNQIAEEVERSCDYWYNEVKDFNSQLVEEFIGYPPGPDIEHYTQMVWARTSRVGCGRVIYDNAIIIVCNYGEAGNLIGDPIYKQGEPCSDCPEKTECSREYKGLCSTVNICCITWDWVRRLDVGRLLIQMDCGCQVVYEKMSGTPVVEPRQIFVDANRIQSQGDGLERGLEMGGQESYEACSELLLSAILIVSNTK